MKDDNLDLPEFSQLTVKEVKNFAAELKIDKNLPEIIKNLNQDSRKGVQKVAVRLQRKIKRQQQIEAKWERMNTVEAELRTQGHQIIVGLDEAGRGPLAGPVVAAAVVLDPVSYTHLTLPTIYSV